MSDTPQDPLEFLRSMWSKLGFPLPGVVTPSVDLDELGKQIADLKAVEGWLKMNLGMLQMSIQGLEMQHATLATWQAVGKAAAEPQANPFAQPAVWPWSLDPKPEAASRSAPRKPARRKKPEAR